MLKLQRFLFYFCWLVIAVSLIHFIPNCHFPLWLSSYILPILLMGATGFLTNYIAIEMLFKPYDIESTKFSKLFHFSFWQEGGALRILTLGLWRIGLIPANKARIAQKFGEEIPRHLLDEDQLAKHVGEELAQLPQKHPELLLDIRNKIFNILKKSPELIRDAIHPILTAQVTSFLHETFPRQKLQKVIEKLSSTWIADEKNRNKLCKAIQEKAESYIPEMRATIKSTVKSGMQDFINEKIPFAALMGSNMVDNAVESYDWTKIDKIIYQKIYSDKTVVTLSDYLLTMPDEIQDWCNSESGQEQLTLYTKKLHETLISELYTHLSNFISKTVFSFLSSKQIIVWTEEKLIPSLQGYFVDWFNKEGKTLLIQILDLSNRIKTAVDKQDMQTFHQMINALMERHLGTIQVLGFLIGIIIGIMQIF